MGRRSFFSISAFNRIISSANRREREENNLRLIAAQGGDERELAPTYSLGKVDFNQENRNTKIEIYETKKYRTIVRYVTQNHVRYPIYSAWKTKTKTIKKSIKLTNSELESLNTNSDELIRKFSTKIILSLNNENLTPSWFFKDLLKNEFLNAKLRLDEKFKKLSTLNTNKISIINKEIERFNQDIEILKLISSKKNAKRIKIENSIYKIEKAKRNFFLSISTFGLYNYFISNKRKDKLLRKRNRNDKIISLLEKNIENKKDLIRENRRLFRAKVRYLETQRKYLDLLMRLEKVIYDRKVAMIIPLPTNHENHELFIPLKTIIGINYEKIIGCYIIHNKENNKYYVGQSKDVYRRIKQHFNGTVPKNIIFAEDYYLSKFQNKEDLFEVKIISRQTKDELDKTEKELIELYDARNSGYNGTNGNT